MESSWSDSKWRLSTGHKLKWSTLFFLPFPPSLIKIYRCRPEKRTGSVRKNTKLEKKGFKVVHRRWRRSYDQYGNILSHRSLKSSRWFFLLFVSFSITIHICRPHGRRAEVRKNVQLERSGLQSLKIDDDYAVNSPSDRSVKLIFAYPFGCHLAIFYSYLAADLPYF